MKMSVVAFAKPQAAKRRRKQARDAIAALPVRQPPSGTLINAILQYADIQEDLGAGRVLLRLSDRRRVDPVITDLLGRETGRLAEVAILWDDVEDEILRILDRAAGDDPAAPLEEGEDRAEGEEFAFELTPAALAYIAAHEDGL
jgi:hypothetical protein